MVQAEGEDDSDVKASEPEVISQMLEHQAYLIARGVRSAAMEPVQDRYVAEAQRAAERYGLHTTVEDLAEGWKSVWLYKHPHVRFVIEETGGRQPATAFDHWVLGKLFGYSDDAIAGFLLRAGLLTDSDEGRPPALRTGRKGVTRIIEHYGLVAVDAMVRAFAGLLSCSRHGHHLLSDSNDSTRCGRGIKPKAKTKS